MLKRFKGFLLTKMPQKAHDQRRADAKLRLRIYASAVQAVDHQIHRHAARRMGLRVKEQLSMNDVVLRSFHKIGMRHVVKILLLQ